MNLEAYLISKKIDPAIFREKEPVLWRTWQDELEQLHPNSFTAQKLYLINPIRRKYPLKSEPLSVEKMVPAPVAASTGVEATEITSATPTSIPKPTLSKPVIPRPVFKPKPKTS